mgnify:FL=1
MYNCQKINIKSIEDFTLSTLELDVAQVCNMACAYCYLRGNTNEPQNFDRWDDLYELLRNVKLSDKLTIGLTTGELFLDETVEYIYNSVKKLNKINRFSDTEILYRLYSNGSNTKNIIDIFDYIGSNKTMISISYDGKDSTRVFKPNRDTDIIKQLEILADSRYSDKIIIRYALHKNIQNMFDTFKFIHELGFKNIEYYTVNNYDRYRDQDYIDEFVGQLEKTLDYFDRSDFKIYNINKYKELKTPRRLCEYGSSLAIDLYGRLTMCPLSFGGDVIDETTIDLCDYKDLPNLYNKFQEEFIIDRSKLDCATCNNQLCEECCSFRSIPNSENRLYQQCKLRHAELAVYDKLYKESSNV